jgi:hypothetical protein
MGSRLEEKAMRSHIARRPLVAKLSILPLLVALLASMLQVTLLARPAAAEMPPKEDCVENDQLVSEELADRTLIVWVCVIQNSPSQRFWRVFDIIPGRERGQAVGFRSSNPPYHAVVNSGLGQGNSNGAIVGAYDLRDGNNNPLVRTIAIKIVVKNVTAGQTCINGTWHQTVASQITLEVVRDLPGTCGGAGNFEVSVAGRFYSVTQNKWITNAWSNSGQLFMAPV